METAGTVKPEALYERDETRWLDVMSELIRAGRLDEVDYPNLAEYLADMARRDRREVVSRLSVLIAHLLKWQYQPDRRSGSWRATVEVQRQELAGALLESGVLRHHAGEAMGRARVTPTGSGRHGRDGRAGCHLPGEECPYTLDDVLAGPIGSEGS